MVDAWLGIDPGKNGAVAVLASNGKVFFHEIRGDVRGLAEFIKEISRKYKIRKAVIEQVHAMPRQGVVSTFTFGRWVGLAEMALVMLGIPYTRVKPSVWKRKMIDKEDYPSNNSKKFASINAVKRLFPHLSSEFTKAKDIDKAEALLMACFCKLYDEK